MVGEAVFDKCGEAQAPAFPVAPYLGLVDRGPQVEAAEFGEQSTPTGSLSLLKWIRRWPGFSKLRIARFVPARSSGCAAAAAM